MADEAEPAKGMETDGQITDGDINDGNAPDSPEPGKETAAEAGSREKTVTVELGDGAIPLDQDAGAPEAADASAADDAPPAEYELTLPDGFEADAEAMNEFKKAAAELKLPKEGAQKLFDMFHKKLEASGEKAREALKNRIETLYGEQKKQCENDPDVGGARYGKSRELAARAIVKFAGERGENGEFAFVRELKTCGMANNPQLFKFLVRVGEYVSEAGPAASDSLPPARERTAGDILWGALPNK